MRFSVLMSIYYKEKPEHFNRAMQSIWYEQTVKPDEIVLVEDGELTNDLYSVINDWESKLGRVLKRVPLERSVKLGQALNIGLKECSYELVARMDTDDISLPYRFEKQLKVFEKDQTIDVCSGWVSEFVDDENVITSYRKVPENHEEIVKYAKFRCPVNHPAVMYKKSSVLNVGGYGEYQYYKIQQEDYHLWVRMILEGARFYNIQEPLVKMRFSDSMIKRRAGIYYAKSELRLLNEFKNLGFLTTGEYIKNIFLRVPIRLMPVRILKAIYKLSRAI